MFTLLQEMGEPVTDTAITFVAPTTAIMLTLMVVFCLMGRPAHVRWANLILAPVYLLLNIGFMVDAVEGLGVLPGGLLHPVQSADHLAGLHVARSRREVT